MDMDMDVDMDVEAPRGVGFLGRAANAFWAYFRASEAF